MDAKVTLRFDASIIAKAKKYAAEQGISLSRLVELLLRKTISASNNEIETLPVSDWVMMVAEGPAEYNASNKSRKELKDEFFKSRK